MRLSFCKKYSTGAFFFVIICLLSKVGGKMTKILSLGKIRAVALVFLFCLCGVSFAQNNFSDNKSGSSKTEAVQKSDSVSENSPALPVQNQAPYWSVSAPENQSKAPSSFALFLRMVISLLIVIALVYFVVKIFRKNSGFADSDDSFLRKVSQISIGAGKSVQIVTLLENAYLIGVTDSNINLLAEIKDKELVDSLNLIADKNQKVSRPKSFADVLDIFLAKGSKNGNAFSDSARHVSDMLKNQRDRFNRGGEE